MSDIIDFNEKFKPRWYQEKILDALHDGYKKMLVLAPRRSGKDLTLWNYAYQECAKQTQFTFYGLPTSVLARRVIWDGFTNDGTRLLDLIDRRIIIGMNEQQMKITFWNGSILQVGGVKDIQTALIGTNPKLIIFSEFSKMANGSSAFSYVRPISAGNRGTIICASTPWGKNHMWQLHQAALEFPDWKVLQFKTEGPDGTNHIDPIELAKEKAQMEPGLFEQEFNCSYEKGVEGQIFGRQIEFMRQDGRICHVPWMPDQQVCVSMDIGVNDHTAIIFYQVVDGGNTVRIIDCYANKGLGLDHYIKIIKDKPYSYRPDGLFFPHDMRIREYGNSAMPRYVVAQEMGLDFTILDRPNSKQDAINNAWFNFSKVWIDENKCKGLISALENYRRGWDEEKQIYTKDPIHNWASDYADAFIYMCQSLNLLKQTTGLEEFEKAKAKALYGSNNWQLGKFNIHQGYK